MNMKSPINQLDDARVIAIAESRMPTEEDARLSDLLNRRREELLSAEEEEELRSLIAAYYIGWQRKTEALVEAVKRGLRPALQS